MTSDSLGVRTLISLIVQSVTNAQIFFLTLYIGVPIFFFKVIFPRRAGLDRKHNVAYIKSFHCRGGKIPGENPGEKPSL